MTQSAMMLVLAVSILAALAVLVLVGLFIGLV